MKTFIYTKKSPNDKKLVGQIEINIYHVKNNKPTNIGTIFTTFGSSKGNDSEVFRYLIENKYIPKYYYNLSKNDWRGAGYYCFEVKDMGINIMGLI